MTAERIVLALALCLGCAEWPDDPPDNYSISDGFTTGEADTIRAAVAAWCDATGHCPVEALWAERGRFELVDHIDMRIECPVGVPCQVSAYNDSDVVHVARDRHHPYDLALLYTIVAHEWGHYCARHTAHGLMAAIHSVRDVAMAVDDEAVAAWRAGCPGEPIREAKAVQL
jgi:hypothetical protein